MFRLQIYNAKVNVCWINCKLNELMLCWVIRSLKCQSCTNHFPAVGGSSLGGKNLLVWKALDRCDICWLLPISNWYNTCKCVFAVTYMSSGMEVMFNQLGGLAFYSALSKIISRSSIPVRRSWDNISMYKRQKFCRSAFFFTNYFPFCNLLIAYFNKE